jgi:hypothetical protein
MNYVRRQRAGSQEFGDKAIHAEQAEYHIVKDDDEDKQE